MKKILLLSFFYIVVSAQGQAPMITEWEFTSGTVAELVTRGSADYIIKDASNQTVASGSLTEGANTISVPSTGVYTMEINNSSNFAFRGTGATYSDEIFPKELKKLLQWGDVDLNTNLTGMFANGGMFMNGKFQIIALDVPDFKPNTNLSAMFYKTSYFEGDLSGWDVSNVTDMSNMFSYASSFTSDLSGWDVSNVVDMSRMFYNASSFISDLSAWDVSNVTDMNLMFYFASSITSDLSGWDVSNVTSMVRMFEEASSFKSDLSSWDVSNVTDMKYMFSEANSFKSDLSAWDVSNVTDMYGMFSRAISFKSDLSAWDVSNVTNMSGMFGEALSFTSDLSGWDVSNVTEMQWMFALSGMTCSDYSKTLIGWSSQNVNSDIKLGARYMHYGPAAVDARNFLINNKGWTIDGDTYNEDCVLGVNDMNLISDIKVINPVKDRIQLITKEKIDRVTVYDTSGKKVKEFTGLTASAADLPQGIYILMIQTTKDIKSIKVLKE